MNQKLSQFLGIKSEPSEYEKAFFLKTIRAMRLVSWIPGIRMVAICNSLSMYASDEDSDIDLFVVSDPHRMWLVRILTTAVFHFLRLRRHGARVKGRFCLSFFATTNALDFSEFAIENDIYLTAWIEHLKPIMNIGECYEEFLQKNAHWAPVSIEQVSKNRVFERVIYPTKNERFPIMWDTLDRVCKWLFKWITLREYRRLGKPWGVIISDDMLKFHENDQREKVRESLR